MTDPRRANVKFLATLTLAAVAAALPLKHAAQSVALKPQSPNGKIIFQSTQGSDGFTNDIFVMDADGKHQTRLTDDPGDDVSALWSQQGDKIAFLSNRRGGDSEIYLMNTDGSNQHPLRDASPVFTDGFKWSPDGTRLAYASGGNVYVIEVEGTAAPVNVSVNKPAVSSDDQPGWSPNGGQLTVRNSTACGGCSDIYVINAADGGGRIALSTGPGSDTDPSWSPSGNFIAYEGDRGVRGIYVTAADGTGTETKVSGAVESFGSPAWSPDGMRLAFRSQTSNVYVVKADATSLMAVSDVPCSGGNIFWAPDGSKVGFHDANGDGWVDIFVVSADGSSRRAVNYTKTKRADEFSSSWQKVTVP
jgi:Tol biopolymer transport system component